MHSYMRTGKQLHILASDQGRGGEALTARRRALQPFLDSAEKISETLPQKLACL